MGKDDPLIISRITQRVSQPVNDRTVYTLVLAEIDDPEMADALQKAMGVETGPGQMPAMWLFDVHHKGKLLHLSLIHI